jgi:hypothetical protein
MCGEFVPWWRKVPDSQNAPTPREDETVDPDAYRAGRAKYVAEGKGVPPPGAE